ncbi:MAG: ABC transporter ATP-binding protein [Lachnospiraceae bacterium]|nr:ABC transporter ATP-binding protein [Lachnospiraceae bacterium]
MILEVKDIKKKYGKKEVLNGVSFEMDSPCILSLFGSNGTGKTTLVSIIAGLLKQNEGSVTLYGIDSVKNRKAFQKMIGLVSQEIALYEELSGKDNISLFAKLYHLDKKQETLRVNELKELLNLTDEDLKTKVGKMSGGMRRKINLATSLLNNPKLLLLDEPTANLDYDSEKQIMDAVKKLSQSICVILITHSLDTVKKYCDRICVLSNGVVAKDTTAEEFLAGTL